MWVGRKIRAKALTSLISRKETRRADLFFWSSVRVFGEEERALPAKRAFFLRKRTLSQGGGLDPTENGAARLGNAGYASIKMDSVSRSVLWLLLLLALSRGTLGRAG
jgi:hypothetical protein